MITANPQLHQISSSFIAEKDDRSLILLCLHPMTFEALISLCNEESSVSLSYGYLF